MVIEILRDAHELFTQKKMHISDDIYRRTLN